MSNKTITTTDLDEVVVINDPIIDLSGEEHRGNYETRFHAFTVHRMADGGYVCHIQYCTNWEAEIDQDWLVRFNTLVELRDQMIAHGRRIPDYVRGFPPLRRYAQRQTNLHNWLRARWGDLSRTLIVELRALGLE